MKYYSQLPKVWCVMGINARRYSSERLWEFTIPLVEHCADTYIKFVSIGKEAVQ